MSIKLPRTIKNIRAMTDSELANEFWHRGETATRKVKVPVIELDDGTILYPSVDAEGNGPGVLLGVKDGVAFMITPD